MKHLTTDEIINFVTFDSLTKENLELAAMVNAHILICEECREKVKAFQAVSDSLTGTLTRNPAVKSLDGMDK